MLYKNMYVWLNKALYKIHMMNIRYSVPRMSRSPDVHKVTVRIVLYLQNILDQDHIFSTKDPNILALEFEHFLDLLKTV